MAAAPEHLVCAQLLLKGKMWCPQNMGTQGNLGWVLLHRAAVRCLSAVEKYLSPIFPTKENNSICCLVGGCSPVQTCTEHPLTGGVMLGVPGTAVCVLLWVSLTRLNLPLTQWVSQSSWTQTVFFPRKPGWERSGAWPPSPTVGGGTTVPTPVSLHATAQRRHAFPVTPATAPQCGEGPLPGPSG